LCASFAIAVTPATSEQTSVLHVAMGDVNRDKDCGGAARQCCAPEHSMAATTNAPIQHGSTINRRICEPRGDRSPVSTRVSLKLRARLRAAVCSRCLAVLHLPVAFRLEAVEKAQGGVPSFVSAYFEKAGEHCVPCFGTAGGRGHRLWQTEVARAICFCRRCIDCN
jgi:hypothetical protein